MIRGQATTRAAAEAIAATLLQIQVGRYVRSWLGVLPIPLTAIVPMAMAGGCQTPHALRQALAMDGPYLLYGFDAITTPDQPAEALVRLQKGSYFNDQEGRLIELYEGERLAARAYTDDEGFARMTFTPDDVGDYMLTVRVPGPKGAGSGISPTTLLVACRDPSVSIVIVDIDKTLVASSFDEVLTGQAQPMADSADVLNRLSEDHTIVYMTLRPDYFGPTTKAWLDEHGYPRGPLWVARFGGLLDGNRDYRIRRIRGLRQRFPNVEMGLGDKISSVNAYLANEVHPVLFTHTEHLEEPDELRQKAAKLDCLPESVDVVQDWKEARQVMFQGTSYTPGRMVKRLRLRADRMEQEHADDTSVEE